MDNMTIGKRVRARREEIGINQTELALMTKLSQTCISELENGKYNPKATTLVKISRALRTTVSELIGEEREVS